MFTLLFLTLNLLSCVDTSKSWKNWCTQWQDTQHMCCTKHQSGLRKIAFLLLFFFSWNKSSPLSTFLPFHSCFHVHLYNDIVIRSGHAARKMELEFGSWTRRVPPTHLSLSVVCTPMSSWKHQQMAVVGQSELYTQWHLATMLSLDLWRESWHSGMLRFVCDDMN